MTEGEKMIWAAVYAQRLTRGFANVPSHVVLNKERWTAYEENVVHQAVEAATGALHRLRGALHSVVDGYGPSSDEVRAVREMLGVAHPSQESEEIAKTSITSAVEDSYRVNRTLPPPESMHGYADQFGGSDYGDEGDGDQ